MIKSQISKYYHHKCGMSITEKIHYKKLDKEIVGRLPMFWDPKMMLKI